MSLPSELRALCFHLSNTQTSDLPRLTPTLLRHVSRCQTALSSPAGNASKAEASGSSVQVQVHKLKTQLSSLLNGKSPEGRFVTAVLIKAVVEVGGWEVLRGSEAWVRGLLSILGKPDSAATKELCIVALTKIYCMTHPYQTLVREITTPTLPAYITLCLNMLPSKSPKTQFTSSSTTEIVFRSFATLLPRHITIFRSFVSQIRAVAKPYLASTLSDGVSVPKSLAESARHLMVLSHLTVVKGGGGEEWGKAVRNLIKEIHVTADHVFRAVVEDWESSAGYNGAAVDVNVDLSGGATDADDLPRWNGIDAGVERLKGFLALLEEYIKNETLTPVSIPLGAIIDLITRILSIAIPSSSQSSARQSGVRLHPAIDSDEKAGLWAGMPQIYVAALQVISTMAVRLQDGFMPMAEQSLNQLAWIFSYGKHDSEFRSHTYRLTKQVLLQIGPSLSKQSSAKCSGIIRSCCNDLIPINSKSTSPIESGEKKSNGNMSNANQNADTFLQSTNITPQDTELSSIALSHTASELLPLFLSHYPQNHLDISLRSLIERTAILTHNQAAMLSSILNPFVEKNGKAMTSILPHLTRAFPNTEITEILLRPRMPLVPSTNARLVYEAGAERENEDEEMEVDAEDAKLVDEAVDHAMETGQPDMGNNSITEHAFHNHPGLGGSSAGPQAIAVSHLGFGNTSPSQKPLHMPSTFIDSMDHEQVSSRPEPQLTHPQVPVQQTSGSGENFLGARKNENLCDEEDSDDESVHLTMELDTDSDSEG